MTTGRPSDFTPEVANEICERLSKGESLRKITGPERDDFMPSETTVRRWLAGDDDWSTEFRRQYAHAREAQADHYADEIVSIADCTDLQANPFDGSVPMVRDPQRDRLRIDARKWVASKLAPKKYGDRTIHAGDDENPVKVITAIERRIVRPAHPDG